jgi:hypothetical protein
MTQVPASLDDSGDTATSAVSRSHQTPDRPEVSHADTHPLQYRMLGRLQGEGGALTNRDYPMRAIVASDYKFPLTYHGRSNSAGPH